MSYVEQDDGYEAGCYAACCWGMPTVRQVIDVALLMGLRCC